MNFRTSLVRGAEILHGAYFHHGARDWILDGLNFTVYDHAVLKAQKVGVSVAVHLELEPGGECVHAGDAHAVQTAGNLVAVVIELAAGVQFGEGDFGSRALGFVLVVELDGGGNAAAVVHDAHGVVHVNRDEDVFGKAGHGFVNGVVHDFVDELMKTGTVAHVADIHAGTLSDGFKPFQNLDVRLVVRRRRLRLRRIRGGVFSRFNISHGQLRKVSVKEKPECRKSRLKRAGFGWQVDQMRIGIST